MLTAVLMRLRQRTPPGTFSYLCLVEIISACFILLRALQTVADRAIVLEYTGQTRKEPGGETRRATGPLRERAPVE